MSDKQQCTWIDCENEATGEDSVDGIMNLCKKHAKEMNDSLDDAMNELLSKQEDTHEIENVTNSEEL